MRILHLLSQTHLTGAETYAATLIRKQIAASHKCYVVSDTLTTPTDATYLAMAIHDRRYTNRLRNVAKLARFCKRERIDVIHAHSRAASWVANVVRYFVPVAYVSTVHGRQAVHFSSARFNVYGRHIIAVCERVRDHLVEELNIDRALIRVIRNGVD